MNALLNSFGVWGWGTKHCILLYQLTYQAFDVEGEVSALKVGVRSIPVQHNLSGTLIYQLVVLRPAEEREWQTYSGIH